MNLTPQEAQALTSDSDGTSYAFDQLEFCASVLAWDFDERIAGAPAEPLRQWRDHAEVAWSCLADIKRKLEIRT